MTYGTACKPSLTSRRRTLADVPPILLMPYRFTSTCIILRYVTGLPLSSRRPVLPRLCGG